VCATAHASAAGTSSCRFRPGRTATRPDVVKTVDMLMLMLVLGEGGRARSAAEYPVVYERSGLRLAGRTTLPSLSEVFELVA
jgi:hypothetical protein